MVGTPLGNPGDLSPRARACLEEADLVLAEDTKREGLACARWGVTVRRFVSYHDHNEKEKASSVLELLREGKNIALISDAGMPVMADPGYVVIRACREAGLPVSVIPGPCAPVTALAGSGIPPQPFIFFGFLAFFFWHLLEKGGVDERLLSNRRRAGMLLLTFFTLLSFLLLFLLDRGVGADAVLLVGSLGYALGMILSPVLTLVLDRAVD